MVVFQDIQDVEEWLAPLNYIAFWDAVASYNLTLQDRDHCDGLIAGGDVSTETILKVLKGLAVMELRAAFDPGQPVRFTFAQPFLLLCQWINHHQIEERITALITKLVSAPNHAKNLHDIAAGNFGSGL